MIVEMKKITLLCLAAERDRTLEALADAGVMHLALAPKASDSSGVEEAARSLQKAGAALAVLRSLGAGREKRPVSGSGAEEAVDSILALDAKRKECGERLAALRSEHRLVEPLGDFDPALVKHLAAQGVRVRLARVGKREDFRIPDGMAVFEVGLVESERLLAVVGEGECPGREIPLPRRRLREIEAEISAVEKEQQAVGAKLAEYAVLIPRIEALEAEARVRLQFAEARAAMGRDKEVAWLQGYCPAEKVESLRQLARQCGWGLVIEDPTEEEDVPTLLRPVGWAKPILFLMDAIGIVPGYWELDISAAFLLFYTLFFAMLVSDAGYGMVFLGLTLAIKRFAKKAPPEMPRLLGILSVATIIWGVLTGSVFGIDPDALPGPLRAARVRWLTDERNLMELCFLIGAIHLTVAHAWNALRRRRSLTALAQAGWIAVTWTMYFAAGAFILGKEIPGFVPWLLAAGVLLIALFMTPASQMKTEWHQHIMLPLSIVGNFGDIVSYIRLFAVGSAGTAISMAFKEMALGRGINGFWAGAAAALILFAAHSMNILLSVLGVVVHGVRLNTLEFSGHIGLQWSGKKYRPFSREIAAARQS